MKKTFSFLLIVSFLLTACQKQVVTDNTCTCSGKTSFSEEKELLTAHTWQINEVIDPISGTRYKRGVIEDDKDFASARYIYENNGTLTGVDWFGNTITNNCYILLDNKKMNVTTPSCSSIYDIITLDTSRFSYKANDGSIFIFGPIEANEPTGDK